MADVELTIGAASGVAVPAMPRRVAEATYTRELAGGAAGRAPVTVHDVVLAALDDDAAATMTFRDIAPATPVLLRFLSGTGASRLDRTIAAPTGTQETVDLSAADIAALAAAELVADSATPTVRRQGRLVPVGTIPVAFATADLRIAIVQRSDWTNLGLATVFNLPAVQTTSAEGATRRPAGDRRSGVDTRARRRRRRLRSGAARVVGPHVAVVVRRRVERCAGCG